jgi:hypothetical protein
MNNVRSFGAISLEFHRPRTPWAAGGGRDFRVRLDIGRQTIANGG